MQGHQEQASHLWRASLPTLPLPPSATLAPAGNTS